jgi:hypothetical protein
LAFHDQATITTPLLDHVLGDNDWTKMQPPECLKENQEHDEKTIQQVNLLPTSPYALDCNNLTTMTTPVIPQHAVMQLPETAIEQKVKKIPSPTRPAVSCHNQTKWTKHKRQKMAPTATSEPIPHCRQIQLPVVRESEKQKNKQKLKQLDNIDNVSQIIHLQPKLKTGFDNRKRRVYKPRRRTHQNLLVSRPFR